MLIGAQNSQHTAQPNPWTRHDAVAMATRTGAVGAQHHVLGGAETWPEIAPETLEFIISFISY